jgi:hypothetical protein
MTLPIEEQLAPGPARTARTPSGSGGILGSVGGKGVTVLLVAALVGCAAHDSGPAPETKCTGELCAPPLLCGEGEAPIEGKCTAVGVAECGPGFERDGRGCKPINVPCPDGQLAQLGETKCHLVAECGTDKYGAAPSEPALYVDAAYTGTDSDGTIDRPFTTIGAVAGRAGNPLVRVAAGKYTENLSFARPIRIYGRCPSMVEITATTPLVPTIDIGSSVELHNLGVSGAYVGIRVLAGTDALVDRVWVHDTGERGFVLERSDGSGSAIVRDSLIERARYGGVSVLGGTALIERVVVRDVRVRDDGKGGIGMPVLRHPMGGNAKITIKSSIIDRASDAGVAINGADVSIENSWIHAVRPNGKNNNGVGVARGPDVGKRGEGVVTIASTVIDDCRYAGISSATGELVVRNVTVRGILEDLARKNYGQGIYAFGGTLTIEDSDVEHVHHVGILAEGTEAKIARAFVSDVTPPSGNQESGVGIGALPGPRWTGSTTMLLSDSRVTKASLAGVLVVGSNATLRGVMVSDLTIRVSDSTYGDGIVAMGATFTGATEVTPSTIDLSNVIVRNAARAGVTVGASIAKLGSVTIECAAFPLSVGRRYEPDDVHVGDFSLEDLGGNRCGCGQTASKCVATPDDLTPVSIGR